MKKRLLMLVYALALVAIVAVNAHGFTLAVASWNAREDVNCDWPGVPFEVVDSCRFAQAMASWGQQ